jgi:hypothetical protein
MRLGVRVIVLTGLRQVSDGLVAKSLHSAETRRESEFIVSHSNLGQQGMYTKPIDQDTLGSGCVMPRIEKGKDSSPIENCQTRSLRGGGFSACLNRR